MSEWLIFGSLFGSSFLSATLLPGSSEVLLAGLLLAHQQDVVRLVVVATVGNTLGGMTNLIIGRLLPEKIQSRHAARAKTWLKRWGPAALLLSWVPVIGDLLCVAAGWLRLSWLTCLIFLGVGKALRYIAVATATLQGIAWWH